MNFLAIVGALTLSFLAAIGNVAMFAGTSIYAALTPPYYPKAVLRNLISIGYYSLPVVGLTAVFTGAVLALQSYTGFSRFNAESSIAAVVVISITRELGPVLAGLMVAGRVGAATAAELGTSQGNYLKNTFDLLEQKDVVTGLVKASIFGFIINLMGCYHGYRSKGGANGVGIATTNAVVTASMLILLSNYLATEFFFSK